MLLFRALVEIGPHSSSNGLNKTMSDRSGGRAVTIVARSSPLRDGINQTISRKQPLMPPKVP